MEIEEYRKMDAEEDRMWWYRATRKSILHYFLKFQPESSCSVLDSGCGTGGFLKMISRVMQNGNSFGIELDNWAAEQAHLKSGYPVTRGSVHQLPFADMVFSTIISTDVLYHRDVDDIKATEESYRCLSNGGIYIVQVPAYQWMSSAHDKKVFGERRYTRSEVEDLLERAGFNIVISTYRNTFLFPLMVMQRKLLKADNDDSDVKSFPIFIEWVFNIIMALEQVVLNVGLTFPFGGSVVVVGVKND